MPEQTLPSRSRPMPSEAAHASVEAESLSAPQRLYGVFDLARADRVAGWAIDRADSDAVVEVEVRREGRLISTARADRHRSDLVKGGIGTGNYGFVVDITPPIEPGLEFTVTATARNAGGDYAELKRGGGLSGTASPEKRLLERICNELFRFTRADAARPAPPAEERLEDAAERLRLAVDRIEVAQTRLEAALSEIEPEPEPRSDAGLRIIAYTALVVALSSLAVGVVSFWFF